MISNKDLWQELVSHAEAEAWSFGLIKSPDGSVEEFELFGKRVLDTIFNVVAIKFCFIAPPFSTVSRAEGVILQGETPCSITENCGIREVTDGEEDKCSCCHHPEWIDLFNQSSWFLQAMTRDLAAKYIKELSRIFPTPNTKFNLIKYLRENNLLEGG